VTVLGLDLLLPVLSLFLVARSVFLVGDLETKMMGRVDVFFAEMTGRTRRGTA